MADYINDVSVLMKNYRTIIYSGLLPENLSDKLQAIPGNDADQMCQGMQTLYANYPLLPDRAKQVAAEMFEYAVRAHWTSFNEENSSREVVAAIDLDLAGNPPSPELFPAPIDRYSVDASDWRNPAPIAEDPDNGEI